MALTMSPAPGGLGPGFYQDLIEKIDLASTILSLTQASDTIETLRADCVLARDAE